MTEHDLQQLDFKRLQENEPDLGPAWAVVMLVLYLLKREFPAEPYTAYWWFQMYVLAIVAVITILVLYSRYRFFRGQRLARDAEIAGDPAADKTGAAQKGDSAIE